MELLIRYALDTIPMVLALSGLISLALWYVRYLRSRRWCAIDTASVEVDQDIELLRIRYRYIFDNLTYESRKPLFLAWFKHSRREDENFYPEILLRRAAD